MGLTRLSLCLKLGLFLSVFIWKAKGSLPSKPNIPIHFTELKQIPVTGLSSNLDETKFLQEQLNLNQAQNAQNGLAGFSHQSFSEQFQGPGTLHYGNQGQTTQNGPAGFSLHSFDGKFQSPDSLHLGNQGQNTPNSPAGLSLNSFNESPDSLTHGSQGQKQNSPEGFQIHNFNEKFQSPNSFQSGMGQLYPHIQGSSGHFSNTNSDNFNAHKYPISDFSLQSPTPQSDLNIGLGHLSNQKINEFTNNNKYLVNQNNHHGFSNDNNYQVPNIHSSHPGQPENYNFDLNQQGLNGDSQSPGKTDSGGHLKLYFKYREPNNGHKTETYSSNAYYYENTKINRPNSMNNRDDYIENKGNGDHGSNGHGYQTGEQYHQNYNSGSKKNDKTIKSSHSKGNGKQNKASYVPHQQNGNKNQYNQYSHDSNAGNNNGNHYSYAAKQNYGNHNGQSSQNPNKQYGNNYKQQHNKHISNPSYSNGHNQQGYNAGPYNGNKNNNQSPSYSPNKVSRKKNMYSHHTPSSNPGYNNNPSHNSYAPYQSHGNGKKASTVDCSQCNCCPEDNHNYNSGPSQAHGNSHSEPDSPDYDSNQEPNNEDSHNQYPEEDEEDAERNNKPHRNKYQYPHGNRNKGGVRPGQGIPTRAGYSNKPTKSTHSAHTPYSNHRHRPQNTPHTNSGNMHQHSNPQNTHAKRQGSSYLQRKMSTSKPKPQSAERTKTKPVIHEIYMSHPLIKDNDVFLKGIP